MTPPLPPLHRPPGLRPPRVPRGQRWRRRRRHAGLSEAERLVLVAAVRRQIVAANSPPGHAYWQAVLAQWPAG